MGRDGENETEAREARDGENETRASPVSTFQVFVKCRDGACPRLSPPFQISTTPVIVSPSQISTMPVSCYTRNQCSIFLQKREEPYQNFLDRTPLRSLHHPQSVY